MFCHRILPSTAIEHAYEQMKKSQRQERDKANKNTKRSLREELLVFI